MVIILISKVVSVYLEPSEPVRYLRDDLRLTCHHSIQGRAMWLANGSRLDDISNPLNRFVTFVNTPPSYNISRLQIDNMTEIVNETEIRCYLATSSSSVFSNNVTILLQGKI